METLATLERFVDKYPQIAETGLQYAFLGGTAIRLHQEKHRTEERRPISDFDIVIFNGQGYPVHSCTPENVFESMSLDQRTCLDHVETVDIRGRNYQFMDGDFLTVSKTCVIDIPREKDYFDIKTLQEIGAINPKELKRLLSRTRRVTRNSGLVVKSLMWLLEDTEARKVKLFQSFPWLVNLFDETSDSEEMRERMLEYAGSEEKTGYQVSTVIRSISQMMAYVPESRRKEVLEHALTVARENSYTDFDRIVHQRWLPSLKYASQKQKGKSLVADLLD